jgi:hypothetical protein
VLIPTPPLWRHLLLDRDGVVLEPTDHLSKRGPNGVQETQQPEALAPKEKTEMTTANVEPIYLVAAAHGLKKGLDEKAARNDLGPGVHKNVELDLHVKIDELRIAADTDKAPTASIPLLPAMALLLQRFQPSDRQKAVGVLKEVMEQAIKLSKDDSKQLLAASGVEEAQKIIKEQIIASMDRTPVKGKVTPEGVTVTITGMSSGD